MSESSPYQVQERGLISARQFGFLCVTIVIATADVFLPAFVAQEAKQDSWLAVIIALLISLVVANIFLTLGLRYPQKTLIQYSQDILGKPLGIVFNLLYIYFFMDVAWGTTRQLGDLFAIAFNPTSPMMIYCLIGVIVAAYAVVMGLEVITRCNDILLPFGLAFLGIIVFFNIPHMDLSNYLPILAKGIKPPIRGGLLIQGWLLETVVALQLIPFVYDQNQIRRNVNIALLVLGLGLETGVLTIAVFGPLTAKLVFPAYEYVRYASLGEYIQHLDVTIIGVWLSGIFIKIALFYYVAALSLSQLFKLKSYKTLIMPVGAVIISLSVLFEKTAPEVINWVHFHLPLQNLTMSLILPGILLLTSIIRGQKSMGNRQNTPDNAGQKTQVQKGG